MTPKDILDTTRRLIVEHAAGDPDKWWYANRYVFARLQLDERQTKARIKRRLLDAGGPCHHCGKAFESRKNVHLHRLDGNRGYAEGICVLVHGECHRRLHAEEPQAPSAQEPGTPLLIKTSKRYTGKPFEYWWDMSPQLAERLDQLEVLELVKKDTGERCVLPTATLKDLLLPERQTTRGQGNWGIKVLPDHPDELAFEPGREAKGWLFLPVTWVDESVED